MLLSFLIKDIVPPSLNHTYKQGKRRYLSPKAKKFKEDFAILLGANKDRFRANLLLRDSLIKLKIYVCLPTWKTKDGRVRKNDISNRIKLIEDAFFDAIGLDDSYVWDIQVIKVVGPEKGILIQLDKSKELTQQDMVALHFSSS